MELLKTDVNPQGVKIYFDEALHKYTTDKVKDFVSATTLIKDYFPPFEREKIAIRVSDRRGISIEEVYVEWDESGRLGSAVHYFGECKLLNIPYNIEPKTEREKLMIQTSTPFIEKLMTNFEVVAVEKILFSEELKLSGMLDTLLRHKITGKLYLTDWKTNKSIYKKAFNNATGYGFCSQLPDSKFYLYAIQLNLYKYLLKHFYGFTEDIDMAIFHIRTDMVKPMMIPDLQYIIKNIIKERETHLVK